MGLGIMELAIIAAVVLLLFGARAIPRVARSLGSIGGEFEAGRNAPVDD